MAAKTKADLEAELAAAQEALNTPPPSDEKLNIFQRIARIAAEAGALAPESKGGVPFAFRGVDGTVAHLSPLLNKYQVFPAPRVLEQEVTERYPNERQVVKTTKLLVEYTFYGPDGDSVTTVAAGLADDFADRSTAQAMSVAYRIALLQLFHLPTHTKDPEETGQEVLNGNSANAPTGNGNPTVAKAQAARAQAPVGAPAAQSPIDRLRAMAKVAAGKAGLSGSELNALGNEISGKPVEEWWNDEATFDAIIQKLTD